MLCTRALSRSSLLRTALRAICIASRWCCTHQHRSRPGALPSPAQQHAKGRSTPMLSRQEVLPILESLVQSAVLRAIEQSGLEVADIDVVVRSLDATSLTTVTRSAARSIDARRQLAQMWAVLAEVHANLLSGSKVTQRELWCARCIRQLSSVASSTLTKESQSTSLSISHCAGTVSRHRESFLVGRLR